MTTKVAAACLAASVALVLGVTAGAAAAARTSSEPGVTPSSILLGGTVPLTGAASAYASVARGADAYFKYVNAHGGVFGRSITYTYLDDAYNPAQTVQATRRLVEQNKVFALFNQIGTETSIAVRPYLNANKVPQLFVASGATTLGLDAKQYPYTIGFQPSYRAEGSVYGTYLARTRSGSRIAVLFQNDDYGKDLLAGLKQGLLRSSSSVIAAQPYDATAPDVQSQIAKLKASQADVLAVFATPRFAIQAFVDAAKLGWKPKLTITNAASAASSVMRSASVGAGSKALDGSLSIAFLKDPTDPQWRNDAAVKLYRAIMKRYAPGRDADDVYHLYGMAAAYTMVEALRKTGKNLTRDGLVKAAGSLDVKNPFLLPGVLVKTSGTDHFPIEQMLLERWQNGVWHSFGGLWG